MRVQLAKLNDSSVETNDKSNDIDPANTKIQEFLDTWVITILK